jgi:hypothetical protein
MEQPLQHRNQYPPISNSEPNSSSKTQKSFSEEPNFETEDKTETVSKCPSRCEDEAGLFKQVSQDMSEMVHHLNTIQNDISELAGRPISLYDNT